MTNFLTRLSSIIVLILCITIIPVSATITLSGVKFMANVTPGESITYPMTLSATNTTITTTYEFTVLGFGNNADGNYVGIDPSFDINLNSARQYITLDKPEITIAPNSAETVTMTVAVPKNINGGLYALINIHRKEGGLAPTGSSVTTAMNVPVMLTITGNQINETGSITNINLDESNIITGYITTRFINTGNHHYYNAQNKITVIDSKNVQTFTGTTNPLITAIIPGQTINFTQALTTTPGIYTIISTVSINNITLATNSSIITITESPTKVTIPIETIVTKVPTKETPIPTQTSPIGIDVIILLIIGVMGITYKKY